MGDAREIYDALKVCSQIHRAEKRREAPAILKRHGLKFESKNLGAHLIVFGVSITVDFWPGTGKWIARKTGERGYGVIALMKLDPDRMDNFLEGAAFFKKLAAANIPLICLENSQPHGLAMSVIGKYTQKVQPWMFGDAFTKGACLWLKGLPKLVATHKKTDYEKIEDACHKASPGEEREKERSRTYLAIAQAMAEQWG